MKQEVLIPKMKRLDKKQRKIRIPLVNFVLILFCSLLLVGATFVNLSFRHYIIPLDVFTNKSLTTEDFIFGFSIIPQIPIVMFVSSVLGKRMALTSVLLYIIAGLFIIPVFALGGGIHYLAEPGLGYILAYVPATIVVGNLLRKKYSFLNMIFAAILGVLVIHFCGIVYMTFIALVKQLGGTFILGWIQAQSGLKVVYDIIISFVLMLIGKYIYAVVKFISE
ncbi:biotin transporter BioY [bacterium]|nr:biotin transporter BioY [bacterium]